MPIYALEGTAPSFVDRASNWIAPDAVVIGNVRIGCNVGIWFGTVIRGDNELISIGDDTNVQEHTIMHTDPGFPLTIGANCTIGHRAMLHGCTIGEGCLIGMGATLLNGSKIGAGSLVGAGALVTEGKEFSERMLIVGMPAKAVKPLDEQAAARIIRAAEGYVGKARRIMTGLTEV